MIGFGLSLKIQDWIWIVKHDSPLISACRYEAPNHRVRSTEAF